MIIMVIRLKLSNVVDVDFSEDLLLFIQEVGVSN